MEKKAKDERRFIKVLCPECGRLGVFDDWDKCVRHYSGRKEAQVATDVHNGVYVIAVKAGTLRRLDDKRITNYDDVIKQLLKAYDELEKLKNIGVV